MYCKFCEKDVPKTVVRELWKGDGQSTRRVGQIQPSVNVALGNWAFLLRGIPAYRRIQPTFAPRLMRGLACLMLIVVAKGVWVPYRRHSFHMRVRHVGEREVFAKRTGKNAATIHNAIVVDVKDVEELKTQKAAKEVACQTCYRPIHVARERHL